MILTSVDLSTLLTDLGTRFAWSSQADSYRVVDEWERPRSHTVFYRVRAEPGGDEMVVKTEVGEDPPPMEPLFQTMIDVADSLAAAGVDGGHGLRPLAWLDDPPLIVTPYVDGEDLVTTMRRPDDPLWDGQITAWVARAGSMIAAYHQRQPASHDRADADQSAHEAARKLRVGHGLVDHLLQAVDRPGRWGPMYGDFGPGNLLGAGDGELYLIDPPIDPPVALIHRDLANFIFELRRQLAGHGFTRYPPIEGRFDGLRSAFLDAYSRHASPLDPCDQGLISLFEARRALGMARKRFPKRIGDSVWFARSALARRREVMRSRDCHPGDRSQR